MTELRYDITARLERGHTERRIDGSSLQLVSVILSDPPPDPDDPPTRQRPPAAVALRPAEARELAFSLLELAERADRERTAR